jgi:hypothetical protein
LEVIGNPYKSKMKLILKSKKNLHYAEAEWDGEQIIVLSGSRINPIVAFPRMSEEIKRIRNDNSFVNVNNELIVDVTFTSPSSAAQFVTGRSVNGYIAWRPDDKMSLKEYLKK